MVAASKADIPPRKGRRVSPCLVDGLRDLGAAARSDLRDLLIALGVWH